MYMLTAQGIFLESTHQMLPTGGELLLMKSMEGELCRRHAAQDVSIYNWQSFSDLEK